VLQGGLVMAKSADWNSETIFKDIICRYSNTVMYLASKAIEFGEKKQNKGYHAIQSHSRSSGSVPIESPHATSY